MILGNIKNLGKIVKDILHNKESFYNLCPNLKGFKPDEKSVRRIIDSLFS